MPLSRALSAIALLTALVGAVPAGAFVVEEGAICVLNRTVNLEVNTGQGQMRIPLDEGSELAIVAVSPLAARVRSGNFEGRLELYVLEEACGARVEKCKLQAPIKIQEKTSGEGKQWRIKAGATLEVVARGPYWSTVRIGPVEGFTESAPLGDQCPQSGADPEARVGATADTPAPKPVARTAMALPPVGNGARVLVAPFALGANGSAELAALYEDALTKALKDARTDVAGPGGTRPSKAVRTVAPKELLVELVKPARAAGLTHLVVTELSRELPPKPSAEEEELATDNMYLEATDDELAAGVAAREEAVGVDVLVVAVFDLAAGKVTKRVRLKPTLNVGDRWAEATVAAVNPVLPPAGKRAGYVDPTVPAATTIDDADGDGDAGARVATTATAPGASDDEAAAEGGFRPVNVLGLVTLGAGAVTLVGGLALGAAALFFAESVRTSPEATALRPLYARVALGTGIGADALYLVTGVLVVLGGVFYATGIDVTGE